ncbi:hypothetical protein LTR78_008771 [Recurvomyces mirabilis]|uniref:Nudix hydrolase domain-containing protein n=1 Tax=Recurvomyces mirabilis TaxID=574656 RepID=A0AAE0TPE0_9PEZI|nr:hypothetical protein LTR78_008771 [Recurvomyces mirabilis]KAK5160991.1 hypothetical protein LTS14_000785 [Recurvomyces mirabilis]
MAFDHDNSVQDFAVSKQEYLKLRPDMSFRHIATSVLVVSQSFGGEPRILLLQRATSDSHPNKWEPPGGACDDEDPSILHGAARELREETGLKVSRFDAVVGEPYHFEVRSGRRVARFHFAIRIRVDSGALPVVRLDPAEHQHFVWASEAEIVARKSGGIGLEFTNDYLTDVLVLTLRNCVQLPVALT